MLYYPAAVTNSFVGITGGILPICYYWCHVLLDVTNSLVGNTGALLPICSYWRHVLLYTYSTR